MKREATTEPLVEREIHDDGAKGEFVPAGRQLAERDDGLDSYGRTSAEQAAYWFAIDRLEGTASKSSDYTTDEEDVYLRDSGNGAGSTSDKDALIAKYREEHPLPTSFATLPEGDPSLYVAPTVTEVASKPVADQPETIDEPKAEAPALIPAAPVVPVTEVPDGNAPVDVPAHIAEKLPAGTAVSMNPDGALVVSVPREGAVHHIATLIGTEFHELVSLVKAYFERHGL